MAVTRIDVLNIFDKVKSLAVFVNQQVCKKTEAKTFKE